MQECDLLNTENISLDYSHSNYQLLTEFLEITDPEVMEHSGKYSGRSFLIPAGTYFLFLYLHGPTYVISLALRLKVRNSITTLINT